MKTLLFQLACTRQTTRRILTFLQQLFKYHPCTVCSFHSQTQKYFAADSLCKEMAWRALMCKWIHQSGHCCFRQICNLWWIIHKHTLLWQRSHWYMFVQRSESQWTHSALHEKFQLTNKRAGIIPWDWRWPMHHILCELLIAWGWIKWQDIICEKFSVWLTLSRAN